MKMLHLNSKQAILVFGLPLIVLLLIGIFPLLTALWGKTWGYLAALAVYWFLVCLPVSIYVVRPASLFSLYKLPKFQPTKTTIVHTLLLAIPVLLTFFAAFLHTVGKVEGVVVLLAAFFALINGILEELLWRGTFTHLFPTRIYIAYFFSTILFAIWHIAMALAKGVEYTGGPASLIGGALFLGIIWGYVAWRSKSIGPVTLSHIFTNFFAFTGLIYENYFS